MKKPKSRVQKFRKALFIFYLAIIVTLFIVNKLNEITFWILTALFIATYLIYKRYRGNKLKYPTLEEIDCMEGEEFEEFLQYKFKKLGYKAKLTSVTGDYGADLILTRKGETFVVQAKRYSSNVGVAAVQEVVASMKYYEADKGIVVTNSRYTSAAEKLATVNEIDLWDRDDIIRLIR